MPDVTATDREKLDNAYRSQSRKSYDLTELLGSHVLLWEDSTEILDILEFCWEHISKPVGQWIHEEPDVYPHRHLVSFDKAAGRAEFRERVTEILRRYHVAFELGEDGRIRRIESLPLRSIIPERPRTGDKQLDRLIEQAIDSLRTPRDMQRALERVWDAWERLKTIEDTDKKRGISALLDKAADPRKSPKLRQILESEARELTRIGNDLMIRHTEANKETVDTAEQAEYLFHRCFAMIWLLLRVSGRLSSGPGMAAERQ